MKLGAVKGKMPEELSMELPVGGGEGEMEMEMGGEGEAPEGEGEAAPVDLTSVSDDDLLAEARRRNIL
jgi:hypothetical protein